MTLEITEWSIISDITPEWATRSGGSAREITAWRLSWLPDRALTREQAVAGMELDELLSDPSRVTDRVQLARMDDCADRLGMARDQAIVRLAKRIAARLQDELDPPGARAPRLGRRLLDPYVH
ncbi:hypothetical protein [Nocardia panacis]|uniref:hypothetical protein n=1 Tax=Nocardia panacis TaxID=2340916 RepID=UPI00193A0B66|nr:hypothetical protein [Nocardia panacis]